MADNGAPLILLTRPRVQADRFARACAARFGDRACCRIAPLIEIVPTGDKPELEGITALIFTSENGIRCFAETVADRSLPAWCVGPRSAAVAEDCGFTPIAGGGTAEAMIARIAASGMPGPFLHVRGRHARGEIAAELTRRGLTAREAILYDQRALPPSPALAELPRDRLVLVPLFSPRSATLLAEAMPGVSDHLHLICLSGAVAAALPRALRARAEIAENPTGEAMLSALSGHISP